VSVDYLREEQHFCQISYGSILKPCSLRLFWRGVPNKKNYCYAATIFPPNHVSLLLSINGVCVICWESNGTTMCRMMLWDGKPSNHIFRLLLKHGVSPCSATLHECQTYQMPSRS